MSEIGSRYAIIARDSMGRDLSFAEAVAVAREPGPGGVRARLSVAAVYRHAARVGLRTFAEGDPVPGILAHVYGRCFLGPVLLEAEVGLGAIRSHSPQVARDRLACYQIATEIADAANQEQDGELRRGRIASGWPVSCQAR